MTQQFIARDKINELVFDYIQEGVMVTDSNGTILSVNPAFQVVTGYSAKEAIGKQPNILRSGIHDSNFYNQMWNKIRSDGVWSGEVWNKRKNGDLYPEWLTILAVKDKSGSVTQYVGVFTDITNQKTAEEELKKLAHRDPLTGMANRYSFNVRTKSLIETSASFGQKLALFFLDLDRFKQVNDTFGHKAGDDLLVDMSNRIKSLLGNKDFIARLGGDEFSIALANIRHPREAFQLAEAIIQSFEKPFVISGHDIYMSTSIGISFFPEDGEDIDTLLVKADKAMYESKQNGRNQFSAYHEEMENENKETLTMEMELRQAIDREELTINYQPQIHLKTKKVAGIEALIRWNNRHYGRVSPEKFIPLAEETGLINSIGEWVLTKVCRDLKTLMQFGFDDVPIAVNVSPLQFLQGNFVETVRRILNQENVPAQLLDLEVTESTVMPDAKKSVHRLNELKNLGCKLSIDDFGTGYSSLSYLRRFPIDNLKIDKSFIQSIDQYEDDASIVEAIITMAHRLHLKVIAEGAESKRQIQFLYAESCDYVQGFYYSKPLVFSDLVDFLYKDLTEQIE